MSDDERLARRRDNRRRRLSEANDEGPRLAADDVARRRKVAEASQRDTKRGLVRQVDEFFCAHDAPHLQCAAIARRRLFKSVEQWETATELLEVRVLPSSACCTARSACPCCAWCRAARPRRCLCTLLSESLPADRPRPGRRRAWAAQAECGHDRRAHHVGLLTNVDTQRHEEGWVIFCWCLYCGKVFYYQWLFN